jgi:cytochrome d ubiquinol oxidase subunit II
MELNTLWFILIAVLYTGYFVLEGFDMGVGILLPFLGKTDTDRRVMYNTIGPHWDGNEVWLLTAGGATFAAFPQWYATLFSGFYLPLLIILLALIIRGVAFEFRSRLPGKRWRMAWDGALYVGSFVPALLWGIAFTNFLMGVPLDATYHYVGGFWNLLSPFALLGGLVSLAGFTLAGAIFLSLKTTGDLRESAHRAAGRSWIAASVLLALFIALAVFVPNLLYPGKSLNFLIILPILSLLACGWFILKKREGWAFGMVVLTTVLLTFLTFFTLYPNVLPSNPNVGNSMTITNAASGPVTLQTMTIVAIIFVPIVLVYQGWTYWIFRKRLTGNKEDLHY